MFINKTFVFEVMHSRFGYETKEQAKIALNQRGVKEYNKTVKDPKEKICKMAFDREKVSLTRFAFFATSGYTFCHLFRYDRESKYWMNSGGYRNREWAEYRRGANKGAMKMQFKSGNYYEGSQCFFVDIDYTEYEDVKEYISALSLKPTIVYMSFSDGIKKKDGKQKNNPKYDPTEGIESRRFRLCYVFKDIVYGQENFVKISSTINKMIEDSTNEPVQDDCGTRVTQYFNGSMSKEYYIPGAIYEMSDFEIETENNINTLPLIPPTTVYIESPKKEQFDPYKQVSQFLIDDMRVKDYDYVMKHYSNRYRYVYRKDAGEFIDGYQSIDEDYFSLSFPTSKWKDGDSRKKKLYERMCLRRIMFPDLTQDEILFNAYVDLHRFVNNTEDPITIDDLVRNVRSAFSHSVDNLKNIYSNQIKYLKSHNPKRGIIYDLKGAKTNAERNTLMKKIRYQQYERLYDRSLSVKENAIRLNCSTKTIRRFLKDRGISLRKTDEELMTLINPKLSIRENIKRIKNKFGNGVSQDRVSALIKRIDSEKNRLNRLNCGRNEDNAITNVYNTNQEKTFYPITLPIVGYDKNGVLNCILWCDTLRFNIDWVKTIKDFPSTYTQ